MTQQRSDLAGPWGKALLDNSTMQLLLRQSPDELAYLRDALKLTDAEVAQIAHPKTDKRRAAQAYFINGTRGRGTVSVRLGCARTGSARRTRSRTCPSGRQRCGQPGRIHGPPSQ
jgi:hypothetical protein